MNSLDELFELIESDIVDRRGHLEESDDNVIRIANVTDRVDLVVSPSVLFARGLIAYHLNLTILHLEDEFRVRNVAINIEWELDIDIFVCYSRWPA